MFCGSSGLGLQAPVAIGAHLPEAWPTREFHWFAVLDRPRAILHEQRTAHAVGVHVELRLPVVGDLPATGGGWTEVAADTVAAALEIRRCALRHRLDLERPVAVGGHPEGNRTFHHQRPLAGVGPDRACQGFFGLVLVYGGDDEGGMPVVAERDDVDADVEPGVVLRRDGIGLRGAVTVDLDASARQEFDLGWFGDGRWSRARLRLTADEQDHQDCQNTPEHRAHATGADLTSAAQPSNL